jgi:hypothetical protein
VTGPATAPLCIQAMRRRVFAGESPDATDPALRTFVADLVAPYGFAINEEPLAAGRGQSYGDMAEVLAADLIGDPLDLVILAHAVPDVIPGRATATYLSHVWPGQPLAFAVCDQGMAAGFTALALCREYLRDGEYRRGLVFVGEQAALHHVPTDLNTVIPKHHAAVVMLVGPAGPTSITTLHQRTDVPPDRVAGLLGDELAALGGGRRDVTVVLGAGLADGAADLAADLTWSGPVRVAPAGQPFTGLWWELAGAGPGRVLLADYDPVLRYLCLLAADLD